MTTTDDTAAAADGGPQRLDPRMVTVWTIRVGVASAVVVAAVLAGEVVLRALEARYPIGALSGPLTVLAAAFTWWWPRARYRHWCYEVAPAALELRHGVVNHRRSMVPYFRVQQIDVEQGPVERWAGLARLVVRTAASSTDGEIPGVPADRAERLRLLILDRAGSDDAV